MSVLFAVWFVAYRSWVVEAAEMQWSDMGRILVCSELFSVSDTQSFSVTLILVLGSTGIVEPWNIFGTISAALLSQSVQCRIAHSYFQIYTYQ